MNKRLDEIKRAFCTGAVVALGLAARASMEREPDNEAAVAALLKEAEEICGALRAEPPDQLGSLWESAEVAP